MPRGRRPPGALYVWQPDSGEDEKPHQPSQRHLQDVSGSTSQRLSGGQCGGKVTFDSGCCVLCCIFSFIPCLCRKWWMSNDSSRSIFLPSASCELGSSRTTAQHHQGPLGSTPVRLRGLLTYLTIKPRCCCSWSQTGLGLHVKPGRGMTINNAVSWPGATNNPQY